MPSASTPANPVQWKIVRNLSPYCADESHRCGHVASTRVLFPFFPWRYEVCTCSCHDRCPVANLRGLADRGIFELCTCLSDDDAGGP